VVTNPQYTPPVTRATLRLALILGAAAALVGLAVLVPAGYGTFALFGCVGIALGAINLGLAVQSVSRFATTRPSKARFSGSVLGRLAIVTVVAFLCALFFRPAGYAVFGGLAVFQLAAIVSSLLPLIKDVRQR
jgi:hypothetical protein